MAKHKWITEWVNDQTELGTHPTGTAVHARNAVLNARNVTKTKGTG